MTWAIVGLLLSFFTGLATASIHVYVNGQFSNHSNAFLYNGGNEGMHASVNKTAGGFGLSSIRFESLTFRRPETAAKRYTENQPRTQLIQALLFELGERDMIGSRKDIGFYALCCSSDLVDSEGCDVGEVIVRTVEGSPISIPIHFKGNKLEAVMSHDLIEITKTGMYNLYFVFCDPLLYGTIVNGKTVWRNPTGYLPGRLAPMMKFYGLLSLAYLVLGIIWLLQYFRFWRDILQLQNFISLVIALGMCEMTLWYFDYSNFNETGFRPAGITLWAVSVGAIRKTVSRCLLLIVSMGYGVVRPTLGGLSSRVLILGATYFVAVEVFDVIEHVGAINDLAGKEKLLLVLPVAILDAIFIMWIFTSLSRTLEKLLARKLTAKLELYRKFTNTLAVIVVMSIAWIGYELFFKATYAYGERWQYEWIILAFWNALSFMLLCVVCLLWAPSQNATRYAYSDEGPDDFDSEETVALTAVVSTFQPTSNADREKRAVNTDVFRLEDGNEEEKIE
ncbi:hypothetical protein L7F22_017920 [Adiantum nelumboides]|nr:hypothetical protein [Adiantum nelumboides]